MRKILQLLMLALTVCGFAQDGSLDSSFNPPTGAKNGDVKAASIQSDGKILVGGDFTLINNASSNKLARLNADGTIDVTFNLGSGFNNSVNGISTQSDGKILVAGSFTAYNGILKNRIIRLNIDGTVDSTFEIGAGFNNTVNGVNIQSDGKIVVFGNFTTYNGISKNRIIRLNTDGTVDSAFNPTAGANNSINSCAVQSDGKIIIGGDFGAFNGVARTRLARLNADGSLDAAFISGITSYMSNSIKTVCIQPDGKIIIGGNFNSYNGTLANYIARLNSDSTLDATFSIGDGFDSSVNSIAIQADGKLVVAGNFSAYNGTYSQRVVRLNMDGAIDSPFSSRSNFGTDGSVNAIAIQSNGRIMIGGSFSKCNNFSRNRIASLDSNGNIDNGIYPFFENGISADGHVRAVAVQPDGKILIGGGFLTYRGISRKSIARLNPDGTLDAAFNVGTGADGLVKKIVVAPNNKIIIAGDFKSYNGAAANGVVQLNADGTLDTAFNAGGSGANNMVNALALQADGKIIIGGTFSMVNGTPRNLLARLNANGTLDASFIPKLTAGNVWTISVQADGKIVIAGLLLQYNYAGNGEILRLNANGSLDTIFNLGGVGTDYFVYSSAVQTDGKIILGGSFSKFNNIPAKGVVRLNANGSLDSSFKVPELYGNVTINDIAIQNDGKIILGGSFDSFGAAVGNSIMRIDMDGTLDPAFATGTGFAYISALALQKDGKLLVGGNYVSYNGSSDVKYIARLNSSNNLSIEHFITDIKINAYPNPVTDYLKFNVQNNVNISGFEVFDVTGKKIDSNILSTNFIDVKNYLAGIYFLRIKTDSGILACKFIKK